jgi:pyruvate dehydrogenase E2 component (dihydrolipoamide acetyltransferase)
MEEGTLVEWLKRDGDRVEVGEILFTVESDKALNEVEALDSGILRIPPDSPLPGTIVPIGTLLAYLVGPRELAPFEGEHKVSSYEVSIPQVKAQGSISMNKKPSQTVSDFPAISPRARRIAKELEVDWSKLKGTGRTGRIVERDVRAVAKSTRARSTPPTQVVSQRVADISSVTPTDSAIPVSPVRKIIAERMATSARTTAPVTLTTEVDATELMRLRTQLQNDPTGTTQPIPTYIDLLSKLVAQALIEYPALNARLDGKQIILSGSIHIGIAVDTERGLLVPVLRDVQTKSLRQIAQESAALIACAREGQLPSDELRGSTFTITNLGMYDIDAFTPIINLPECAILGVGRIVPKHVVIDVNAERIAIRQMMFLSLTFDHRLVDGAPAARFLQRIKQFVEQPYLWLIT